MATYSAVIVHDTKAVSITVSGVCPRRLRHLATPLCQGTPAVPQRVVSPHVPATVASAIRRTSRRGQQQVKSPDVGPSGHDGDDASAAAAATAALLRDAFGVSEEAFQRTLQEHPELTMVDAEYVSGWQSAATSLLKVDQQQLAASVRQNPWLLMADLGIIHTNAVALSRVLSIEPSVVSSSFCLGQP